MTSTLACWSAQLNRDLLAPGLGGELLHGGPLHAAHLSRPLAALGVGGVAGGLVLALLLDHCLAGHHIVLNVVLLLQGFTLRLVFCAATKNNAMRIFIKGSREPSLVFQFVIHVRLRNHTCCMVISWLSVIRANSHQP